MIDSEILHDICNRLRACGYVTMKHVPILVEGEYPIVPRSADIVTIVDERLIAIETTRYHWQQALKAARNDTVGVDVAMVCMLQYSVTASMRKALENAGIGLCWYVAGDGWPLECVIEPHPERGDPTIEDTRADVMRWLYGGGLWE